MKRGPSARSPATPASSRNEGRLTPRVAAPDEKRISFGTVVLRMHAARGHVERIAGATRLRLTFTFERDLAVEDKRLHVVRMRVRLADEIRLPLLPLHVEEPFALELCFELAGVHGPGLRRRLHHSQMAKYV